MSAVSWILNLWPGLPQLWQRGTWQSLLVAVAFSALLNGALLESFAGGMDRSGWLAVALWTAVGLAVIGQWLWRAFDTSPLAEDDSNDSARELLRLAQTEYLRGHWFQAEKLAGEILAADADDPEARLLLIATLRRSGRREAAQTELARLGSCPGAELWRIEIHQEQKQLENHIEAESGRDQPDTLPFQPKAA